MQKDPKEMSLEELVALQDGLQALVVAGVMRARREHQSWAAIGARLGVSTQEAHRRYAHIWKWQAVAEGLPTGDMSK